MTALALCKSIESAIQWFQIHHRITFATIQNPAVYLKGARVSIFSTFVPRLLYMAEWLNQFRPKKELRTLFTLASIYDIKYNWPRGYKTLFILNSTEHEISTANKS